MNAQEQRSQQSDQHTADLRRAEVIISLLLNIGVWSSLIVIIIGIGVTLARHPHYFTSTNVEDMGVHGITMERPTVFDLFYWASEFNGMAIIMLGVLLLISTPVLRVIFSMFLYIKAHDRGFTIITAAVLGLLIFSFIMGGVG